MRLAIVSSERQLRPGPVRRRGGCQRRWRAQAGAGLRLLRLRRGRSGFGMPWNCGAAARCARGNHHDARPSDRLLQLRNLEPETATLLALLVRMLGARSVVEIGTSNGYSAIWLADAPSRRSSRTRAASPARSRFARASSTGPRSCCSWTPNASSTRVGSPTRSGWYGRVACSRSTMCCPTRTRSLPSLADNQRPPARSRDDSDRQGAAPGVAPSGTDRVSGSVHGFGGPGCPPHTAS